MDEEHWARVCPRRKCLQVCRSHEKLLLKMGVSAGKPIDIAALSAVSVVTIRKKLPPDEVKTVGGGCIVKWMLGGSESSLKQSAKSSVFLLTTTQVISKNDLIASNGSISVELLDGDKAVSFNLGDKCATDLLEPLPGRVLGGTGEALKEVSFVMIPVEKFDDRNWLWLKLFIGRGGWCK